MNVNNNRKRRGFLSLFVALVLLLTMTIGASPVAAADDSDLQVIWEAMDVDVTITHEEREAMDKTIGPYSYVETNTLGAFRYTQTPATGILLSDLLEFAEIDLSTLDPDQIILFRAGDNPNLTASFTWAQLSEERYRYTYPNGTGNQAQLRTGEKDGALPAIIGFNQGGQGPRNFMGLTYPEEQFRGVMVQQIASIEFGGLAGSWGEPYVFVENGTAETGTPLENGAVVEAGTKLRITNNTHGQGGTSHKYFYTTNGQDPVPGTAHTYVFNWNSNAPSVSANPSIVVPEGTGQFVVKAMTYGYGQKPSAVKTFTYNVGPGAPITVQFAEKSIDKQLTNADLLAAGATMVGPFTYTGTNTNSTWQEDEVIAGIKVEDLLKAAGVNTAALEDNRQIIFRATDGFRGPVTWGQLKQERYHYTYPSGTANQDQMKQGVQGDPVPAVVRLVAPSDSANQRNFMGINYPTEQNRNLVCRAMNLIEVGELVQPWADPYVFVEGATQPLENGATIAAGTKLRITGTDGDGGSVKYFYTTDGTEPLDDDGIPVGTMFNFNSNSPTVANNPSIVVPAGAGQFTIKAVTYGLGRTPSSVKTYTYNVIDSSQITINHSYTILAKGETAQLKVFDKNGIEIPHSFLDWSVLPVNESIISVANNGKVEAIGTGKGLVKVEVTLQDGSILTLECRVDVLDDGKALKDEVQSIRLLQNTFKINTVSNAPINVPMQIVLGQNLSALSVRSTPAINSFATADLEDLIDVALEGLGSDCFDVQVKDFRTIVLTPKPGIKTLTKLNSKTLATKLNLTLKVTVDKGATYNLPLTVNIDRKAKLTLKSSNVAFNTFHDQRAMPVNISTNIGRITGIELSSETAHKTNNDKVLHTGGKLKLHNVKNAPKDVTFKVTLDGVHDKTVFVKTKVTAKRTVPKINMAKSVTMEKTALLPVSGAGASLIDKGQPIIVNNANYKAVWEGSLLKLTYKEGSTDKVAAKANLVLQFAINESNEKASLKLTSNKLPLKYTVAKLSRTSATLNPNHKGSSGTAFDFVTVSATTNPVDALISINDSEKLRVTVPKGIDGVNPALNVTVIGGVNSGKEFKVELNSNSAAGKKYTVKIGTKNLTVNVAKVGVAGTATIKAAGTLNVVSPGSTIRVTPTFKNFNFNGGSVVLKGTGSLEIRDTLPNGAVILEMKDGNKDGDVKATKNSEKITLEYTDFNGNKVESKILNISPKHTNPKLAQSVKAITLQRDDRFSEGLVGIKVSRAPLDAKISRIEIVPTNLDKNKVVKKGKINNAAAFGYREVSDGVWAIGFKDSEIDPLFAPPGKTGITKTTVTLRVYFEGSSDLKPVNVKVAVNTPKLK